MFVPRVSLSLRLVRRLFLIGPDISESTFRGTKMTREDCRIFLPRVRSVSSSTSSSSSSSSSRGRKSWGVAERNKCRVTARRFVNGSTSRGGKQITRTSRSKEKRNDRSVRRKQIRNGSPMFQTALLLLDQTLLLLNVYVYIYISDFENKTVFFRALTRFRNPLKRFPLPDRERVEKFDREN